MGLGQSRSTFSVFSSILDDKSNDDPRSKTILGPYGLLDVWVRWTHRTMNLPGTPFPTIYKYTWIFLLCVKFVPFHQKNLPKGRNFTYLEDPGIDGWKW